MAGATETARDEWLDMLSLPIGDHRNLVVEVRGANGEQALAYWTGSVWAHAPVTADPQPLGFRPVAHRRCELADKAEGPHPLAHNFETRFRQLPVSVGAMQYRAGKDGNAYRVLDWANRQINARDLNAPLVEAINGKLLVPTPSGVLEATDGDWLVCGLRYEFYVYKPEIFAETHQRIWP
jgi:hypothetical protein